MLLSSMRPLAFARWKSIQIESTGLPLTRAAPPGVNWITEIDCPVGASAGMEEGRAMGEDPVPLKLTRKGGVVAGPLGVVILDGNEAIAPAPLPWGKYPVVRVTGCLQLANRRIWRIFVPETE